MYIKSMQHITTTELRTKSSELVAALKQGDSVSLVHHSKVIGKINPEQEKQVTITDIKKFKKMLASIKPRKIIPRKDREKVYRQHLMEKYGKGLS